MAEEANLPEAEGGPDIAIAAAFARSSAVVDKSLTAYLDEQRHHLKSQLFPTLWEKWLGVFLRAATALVGMAMAGGAGFLVWQAAHADGLRVEPFSVPPAMAERGLTGEVVAARVIDRLSELQSQTATARPARSYINAWGDKAIKLEIPETGISLEELDSWLRARLGHETPLSGEIVRGETGVTLTARTGEDGAVSVSGPEADIDALTGKLAEAIYGLTQPYRYAIYLMRHEHRPADALPIFKRLALSGTPDDRFWSYNMWAQATELAEGNRALGLRMYQQANAANPDATVVYVNLVADFDLLGRDEEALQTEKAYQAKARPPTAFAKSRLQANVDLLAGAYHDALPIFAADVRTGRAGFGPDLLLWYVMRAQIGEHDLGAARASQAELTPGDEADEYRGLIDFEAGNWRAALALSDQMADYLKAHPHDRRFALVQYAPPLAVAEAELGEFTSAERAIAPTPADCYPCLIARARIAEQAGQRGRAEYWFARATAAGPSLPFAFEAEGRALIERGKLDEAIARFTIANKKTPHFADALEGMGEALMEEKHFNAALAEFTEAEKYAPHWGRLHLKWGEALADAGKKDEAKKQFAAAAALDLTPSEKSELREAAHG